MVLPRCVIISIDTLVRMRSIHAEIKTINEKINTFNIICKIYMDRQIVKHEINKYTEKKTKKQITDY